MNENSSQKAAYSTEEKRAALRKALQENPHDIRVRKALQRSLKPVYVRQAAQRGVFICYTRSDELLAFELSQALCADDIPAWMDALDMPQEGDWEQNVSHALRNCGVLLLLVSSAALHDEEVIGECQYFLETGKVVLPVLVDESDWSQLPIMLESIDMRDNLETGLRLIKNYLHNPTEASAS